MIKTFNTLFVTMFGIGKLKPIPGTFGSLGTVIILYFCFHKFEINSNLILLGLIVIFLYSFAAVTSHTKDKNNKDCAIKGVNISLGINIPTNKLFEKSGNGNIKKPPIKPTTIDT